MMEQLRFSLPLFLSLQLAPYYVQEAESFLLTPLSRERQHGCEALSQSATADAEVLAVADYIGNDIGEELRELNTVNDLYINDANRVGGILGSLFGSSEIQNTFFEDIFGRRVAYFPRSKELKGNIGEESNQQIQQLAPLISGIDLPSLYETNEWTALRKRGSHDMLNKEQMSYDDLSAYIDGGGSAIIPITPDDYLFRTKVHIERALGLKEETGTTMNIYHSGRQAVALNLHYDSYPVFVLQLVGQKEWMVQNDAFGGPLSEITLWKNLTMTPGDFLYIPKGVYHAATTAEGYNTTTSTHATIGLL